MTTDEYYLSIALAVARKSTCLKKQYGSVIVSKSNEIIATGYNGPARHESHCKHCTKIDCDKDIAEYKTCPSIHSEQNAIISAARKDMIGGTLYLAGYITETGKENMNVMPCEICLRLIKNSGIDRVITNKGIIYQRGDDGILRRVE